MQARRMRIAILGTSLAAILGLAGIPSASAAVLYDTTVGGGTAADAQALSGSVPLGDSFLSGTGWTLTGVGLDLLLSAPAAGGFNVYLESNALTSSLPSPNSVGAVYLGTIPDTQLSTSAITLASLSVNQTLAANTRYWIVATYGGRGAQTSAEWIYQNTLASGGLDNAKLEYSSTAGTSVSAATLTPYEMLLTGTIATQGGTSVPEPETWLLMVLPLLGLYFSRKHGRAN